MFTFAANHCVLPYSSKLNTLVWRNYCDISSPHFIPVLQGDVSSRCRVPWILLSMRTGCLPTLPASAASVGPSTGTVRRRSCSTRRLCGAPCARLLKKPLSSAPAFEGAIVVVARRSRSDVSPGMRLTPPALISAESCRRPTVIKGTANTPLLSIFHGAVLDY